MTIKTCVELDPFYSYYYFKLILLALPYTIVLQKFQFFLEGIDLQKISYESRTYESVDEKSLSLAMSQKTMKKIIRED